MKVKLIEKYNMSVGTAFVIEANSVLKIGDKITIDEKDYTIKSFIHPTGAVDTKMITVLVEAIEDKMARKSI